MSRAAGATEPSLRSRLHGPLNGPVDRRAGDAEGLCDLARRVGAAAVLLHELLLLLERERGLAAAEPASGLCDRHTLASAGADKIGFERRAREPVIDVNMLIVNPERRRSVVLRCQTLTRSRDASVSDKHQMAVSMRAPYRAVLRDKSYGNQCALRLLAQAA